MTVETKLVVGILAASVFLGTHHAAADGPAVSEPHPLVGASIEAMGVGSTDLQAFLASGAYYMPVGESFGFELDLSVGLGLDDGDAKEAVAGVGVLYHFAAPKSLKRQLREDRL